MNKNLDLTQDKEKPTVKETSASSIDKIVPDLEHVSNDMAEQQSSSAGGQDKKQKTGDMPTGLTGTQTSLAGASNESESSSKNKIRPSFKKLLAKYDKKGVVQEQKGRPDKVKDTKPSSSQEQSSLSHGNSFNEPIAPWYCWYPCCMLLDYSRMHMQS